MSTDLEKAERVQRSERLRTARRAAGLAGPKAVERLLPDLNIDTYKAHESGRNGFGLADAKRYAKAFKVSLQWLNFGIGSPDDPYIDDLPTVISVPRLSWVSAGELRPHEPITDLNDWPTVPVVGLPVGDWIALEVEGDSMDRISPPGSLILVNRKERKLIANACYVIADEQGEATYKRYRPNPPRFEPVSTNPIHEPLFPDNDPVIIGRVRRSLIDM